MESSPQLDGRGKVYGLCSLLVDTRPKTLVGAHSMEYLEGTKRRRGDRGPCYRLVRIGRPARRPCDSRGKRRGSDSFLNRGSQVRVLPGALKNRPSWHQEGRFVSHRKPMRRTALPSAPKLRPKRGTVFGGERNLRIRQLEGLRPAAGLFGLPSSDRASCMDPRRMTALAADSSLGS